MSLALWSPVASPALLAVSMVACIVILAWSSIRARHVRISAVIRVLVAAGFVALLANPVRTIVATSSSKPMLQVLIDDSKSMGVEGEGGVSRFESARREWFGAAPRDRMEDRFDARFASAAQAGASIRVQELTLVAPRRAESDIHAAIEHAIRASQGGAILVLTDGADTSDRAADFDSLGTLAAARDVRVDAVVPGDGGVAPNVRIIARAEPPVVFDRQPVSLIVDVFRVGDSAEQVKLSVRTDADPPRVIHEEELDIGFSARREIRVPTEWADDETAVFHVQASTIEGERQLNDNAQDVVVEILDDAARVIVFEGQPYWETSFIIDSLRADPSIAVTTVTALTATRDIVRHPHGATQAPTVESLLDNLDSYDVVILGKGVERWFGGHRRAALESFVFDHGGGVFLARDQPVSSDATDVDALSELVQQLSPLELGGTREAGGVLGLSSGASSRGLFGESLISGLDDALDEVPGIVSAAPENGERAMSTVVLRWAPRSTFGGGPVFRDDDPPALAAMQVGSGRTMALTSDGLWRWAMAPDATSESRRQYGSLISRLTRWLALGGAFQPGRELSVQIEPGPHEPGERVEVVLRSRTPNQGAPPRVSMTSPSGASSFLALDGSRAGARRWTASFPARDEGVYVVRAATGEHEASARTTVYSHDREMIDIAPRRASMEAMAVATGGRLWPIDGLDGYLDALERDRAVVSTRRAATEPAWPRMWVFGVVLALLTGVWIADRLERGV